MAIIFVYLPTKSANFNRSGANVRAHLLRKNYSRNFCSIRSAPNSLVFKVDWFQPLNYFFYHYVFPFSLILMAHFC